eukprot:UN33804
MSTTEEITSGESLESPTNFNKIESPEAGVMRQLQNFPSFSMMSDGPMSPSKSLSEQSPNKHDLLPQLPSEPSLTLSRTKSEIEIINDDVHFADYLLDCILERPDFIKFEQYTDLLRDKLRDVYKEMSDHVLANDPRYRVMKELVATEEKYIKQLRILAERYKPLLVERKIL